MAITGISMSDEQRRRVSIGFLNFAHGLDHYVMLIFATVVIGLALEYKRPYDELIALGTASFFAFGIFSLPAGWIADRWSRRNMMAAFFLGCGVALAAAALSPNLPTLAAALFVLGVFAAIYHPVGTAMVVGAAKHRGRTLALNGVCGNLGVALAAGITAELIALVGWRGAFMVPAVVCLLTGAAYLTLVPDDRHRSSERSAAPDVRLTPWVAATVFGLFIIIAMSAGLVFNTVTIALPKIIDERLGEGISITWVGRIATAVFLCGAIAQLMVGRIVERYPPHLVFAAVALLQFAGVVWMAFAGGMLLVAALAVALAAIYAQVTVNDLVIARYTADAWRARVYAVRYFVTYIISGVAVSMIALLYGRGGFDLVLGVTAVVAFGFVIGTAAVAYLVNDVERVRRTALPAE
ncbi:MAG TPA: MFS transporter [Xanthobacteraceae bacterium]|nr:MFS transporter [Xanthobacteraceae bacterium]